MLTINLNEDVKLSVMGHEGGTLGILVSVYNTE